MLAYDEQDRISWEDLFIEYKIPNKEVVYEK
jgi:hypothetical protein